ncbi:MAG: helix-turn-helix domain-containing protein [Aquabacterium sp.]
MTEQLPPSTGSSGPAPDAAAAGARLKAAREAQGMSLDYLAATLKVTPAKLEALESGDLARLPDANFARALAKAVCRQLQIEPQAVLADLPSSRAMPLGPEREPLNAPFKERRSSGALFDRAGQGAFWKAVLSPRWLAPAVLLAGALLVYLLPEDLALPDWLSASSAPPAAVASAASAAPDTVASEPVFAPDTAGSEPAVASSDPVPAPLTAEAAVAPRDVGQAGAVVGAAASAPRAEPMTSAIPLPPEGPAFIGLRAAEDAWIEVRDASGRKVYSGLLKAGQTASVDGQAPMRLRIGNAANVHLTHKGQPVDLAGHMRNNVARLELP